MELLKKKQANCELTGRCRLAVSTNFETSIYCYTKHISHRFSKKRNLRSLMKLILIELTQLIVIISCRHIDMGSGEECIVHARNDNVKWKNDINLTKRHKYFIIDLFIWFVISIWFEWVESVYWILNGIDLNGYLIECNFMNENRRTEQCRVIGYLSLVDVQPHFEIRLSVNECLCG